MFNLREYVKDYTKRLGLDPDLARYDSQEILDEIELRQYTTRQIEKELARRAKGGRGLEDKTQPQHHKPREAKKRPYEAKLGAKSTSPRQANYPNSRAPFEVLKATKHFKPIALPYSSGRASKHQ